MNGPDFESLYQGPLGARLRWEASCPCPCASPEGALDEGCPACGGRGVVWAPASAPFRAGLTTLSARALAAMSQRFGPGMTGDATVSVPASAPCWDRIREGDRLTAVDALDTLVWQVLPGRTITHPAGAVLLGATVRLLSGGPGPGALVDVTPPVPDGQGRVRVNVPTLLRLQAPRRFEVVRDLAQVRAFGTRLPKKLLLRLLDVSVR